MEALCSRLLRGDGQIQEMPLAGVVSNGLAQSSDCTSSGCQIGSELCLFHQLYSQLDIGVLLDCHLQQ